MNWFAHLDRENAFRNKIFDGWSKVSDSWATTMLAIRNTELQAKLTKPRSSLVNIVSLMCIVHMMCIRLTIHSYKTWTGFWTGLDWTRFWNILRMRGHCAFKRILVALQGKYAHTHTEMCNVFFIFICLVPTFVKCKTND